ncbi:MAG TPA: hypothetical protein VLB47_10455, partial [Solirubrobacteraceae bacterium]|nr:hypothetical protein [Solirubrobacteraceae bacterium]
GGDRRLLLGELADAVPGRSYSTPVRRFLAALPRDVLCGADAVSQHVYAERGDGGDAARRDVVGAIERLLERRGCGEATPIWITETGAGGPHAGAGRTGGAAGARADCRALAALLRRWWADPRVTAAFQYTFRDDPAFPVGLADAGLTHAWPALDLLDAWGGDRDPAAPPPALPASCRA